MCLRYPGGKEEISMKTVTLRSLSALLLAALLVCSVAPAMADQGVGNLYMYIETGNSGRLHLRALPSADSQSLGLYPNGTKVLVESITNNNWAFVQVDGRYGYMALKYLTGIAPVTPVPPVTPAPTEDTTLYVATGNSGKLHLREYASQNARSLGLFPNGTAVRVTSRSNGWAFVQVNGMTGYMMLVYLTATAPVNPPAPQPAGDPVLMYVRTGNSGKLHLRECPSQSARSLGLYPNGTPVYAIDLKNGWSQVTVYGQAGYMMTCYLSASSGGITPAPTVTPIPVPDDAVWTYVATGNSGKLHLRENMSTDAGSLGLYPNGTPVAILVNYGAWAYVNVYGRTGYMMTQFLAAGSGAVVTPVPGAPTAAPTALPTAQPIGTATVRQPNNSFVYLRSSPSSQNLSNVICQVPSGTVVTVLQRGDLWSKIQYNGYEGYMVSSYLK